MRKSACLWLQIACYLFGGASLLPADEAASAFAVFDDCRSLAASKAIWQTESVTLETNDAAPAVSGLKAIFGDHGFMRLDAKATPVDWSRYRSLTFDIYNPQDTPVPFTIRIDDAEATGFRDRYERCDTFVLPPKRKTHVVQDLTNLLANDDRLMDCSAITGFYLLAKNTTLYLDAFQFVPLPEKSWRPREVMATAPRVIDNFTDARRTAQIWEAARAKIETSDEHALAGEKSLKAILAPDTDYSGVTLRGDGGKPMDWRGYRTFAFDVFNPGPGNVDISIRLNDRNSCDHDSRFEVSGLTVVTGQTRNVKINIRLMTNLRGFPMDTSAIDDAMIYVEKLSDEHVLYFSNVRLLPEGGGLRNDVMSGRIPGKTPAILGRELLDDPEIKLLIPIFKAFPPKKLAICSHSASISEHWSTSGAFFDVAAEAVKAVNPGWSYEGFHHGGMGASTAVSLFLAEMIKAAPTDTYLLVVPDDIGAMKKLIVDMKGAGSRVFVFDAIKIWGAWSKQRTEAVRELCREKEATFIELRARGYGVEGSQDWMVKDTIHMRTVGHLFYAKELLKEWAKIYGPSEKPVAASAPGSNP